MWLRYSLMLRALMLQYAGLTSEHIPPKFLVSFRLIDHTFFNLVDNAKIKIQLQNRYAEREVKHPWEKWSIRKTFAA